MRITTGMYASDWEAIKLHRRHKRHKRGGYLKRSLIHMADDDPEPVRRKIPGPGLRACACACSFVSSECSSVDHEIVCNCALTGVSRDTVSTVVTVAAG